jgi:hypothetical protein
MLTDVLEIIGLIVGFLIFAGLVRRYGSHALINGFMSPEKADAVFPGWRKSEAAVNENKEKDKK